jgi:hypothetical protein
MCASRISSALALISLSAHTSWLTAGTCTSLQMDCLGQLLTRAPWCGAAAIAISTHALHSAALLTRSVASAGTWLDLYRVEYMSLLCCGICMLWVMFTCMQDALLCGVDAATHAAACLAEVFRVLRKGGAYVLITYGHPGTRLKHLVSADLMWCVTTYTVQKLSLDGMIEKQLNPKPDASLKIQGPLDLQSCAELQMLEDQHFVYVCQKTE